MWVDLWRSVLEEFATLAYAYERATAVMNMRRARRIQVCAEANARYCRRTHYAAQTAYYRRVRQDPVKWQKRLQQQKDLRRKNALRRAGGGVP